MRPRGIADGPRGLRRTDPGISGEDRDGTTVRQQDAAFREAMLKSGRRLTDPRAMLDMALDTQNEGGR